MFPHAADEVKENSERFSPCSLQHMSRLLKINKDKCFVGETSKSTSQKKLLDYHIAAYFCVSIIYHTWFKLVRQICQLNNESNLCTARSWSWSFVWTCLSLQSGSWPLCVNNNNNNNKKNQEYNKQKSTFGNMKASSKTQ